MEGTGRVADRASRGAERGAGTPAEGPGPDAGRYLSPTVRPSTDNYIALDTGL
jgi:hypothetical protein